MHVVVRRVRRAAVAVLLPATLVVSSPGVASAGHTTDAPYRTVVEGLRNPRGLAFDDHRLYVAESGEAGDVCFEGIPTEEGGALCAGLSARISRVDTRTGARRDVVTGLVSIGEPLFAIGATGVVKGDDGIVGLMGANDVAVPPADMCGATPACRKVVRAAQKQLGHLFESARNGRATWKQDVGAFNYQWTIDNKDSIGTGDPSYQPGWADNPDFQPGDANPYGLAGSRGGQYVVDGGSNTLTFVPRRGAPSVVAAFPNPGSAANAYDAVPTCVAPTNDQVAVADLNGSIYLVDGTSVTVAPSAVTSSDGSALVAAGGCAADRKGNVYISDIYAGSVIKLDVNTMTTSWVLPPGTLNFPSGVAVGEDNAVFVSNNSVCPSFPTPVGADNPCGGVTGSIVKIGGHSDD
jgi:hypothetical protein